MPRNIVKEVDETGNILEKLPSNTVFIPIEVSTVVDPVLCSTAKELEDAFKGKLVSGDSKEYNGIEYSQGLGYKLAKHLIGLNFKVLVQGVTAALGEGDWKALEDKNLYDIRFLTNGAFKADIPQKMIDTAKARGDAVALGNLDETGESFSYDVETISGKVADVLNGEFGALFTPAFYTKHSDFVGAKEEVKEVLIPAAFGYLFAYAESIKTNPEWFAIAGFGRGVIPQLSKVKHRFTTAEVNLLQKRTDIESKDGDNIGIAINPIAYIRPAGFIIYGNRTLKKNDAIKKLTATSFLNVRNMISAISKTAFEAANRFTFDQNTETLWVNYKSYIQPTLERIVHGGGALGYSLNKLEADAKATLKAEIIIQPIEAVEDIELTIVMTESDVTVN